MRIRVPNGRGKQLFTRGVSEQGTPERGGEGGLRIQDQTVQRDAKWTWEVA